jgi:hypothetical protein
MIDVLGRKAGGEISPSAWSSAAHPIPAPCSPTLGRAFVLKGGDDCAQQQSGWLRCKRR